MPPLILVALGGAIGAALRYLVVLQSGRIAGAQFPWGTFAVNITGSLAMGVAIGLLGARHPAAPFLLVGVFGGFTTFSAYALDTVLLIERGEVARAALYAGGSVVGAVLALWLGLMLTRGAA